MDSIIIGIISIFILIFIGLYVYTSWCFMKRVLWPENDYELHINKLFCTIWTFSIGLPVTAIVYFVGIIAYLVDNIARLGR